MKTFKNALKDIRRQVKPKLSPAAASANLPQLQQPPEPEFKQLFHDVIPLKTGNRHYPQSRKPSPHPKQQPQPAILTVEQQRALYNHMAGWFDTDELDASYLSTSMPTTTLKKLRAGHWRIVAELDLHGMDRYQAQEVLTLFLHRASARGQCVRVIHGKGFGSDGEPVLKRMVRGWLQRHPDVLAFCESREQHGGSGALMVLLKRRQTSE